MSQPITPKGKLLIFSAPSGSGKTTLVKHLLKNISKLTFSVSATSRLPREEEVNGKDYYFLSAAEFQKKIKENAFLEWEEVYPEVFYGTLLSQIEEKRAAGLHVIFDVDVVGGLNIKKYYGAEALAVFVQVPSIEVLAQRLNQRGTDDAKSIKKRLEKAAYEMTFAPQFDYIIVNNKLDDAQRELTTIVSQFLDQQPVQKS